jgi:hypothetical protein
VIVAVFRRRLREGKTFDDLRREDDLSSAPQEVSMRSARSLLAVFNA